MEQFIESAVGYMQHNTHHVETHTDVAMKDAVSPTSTVDTGTAVNYQHKPKEGPGEDPADRAGLDVLGGGMRDMVDLVNRLRASGIEDLGMPLPRIAVVGNQSAGKSSLIEAISGIKVPRYSGTCTRCPLEISLSEASDPSQPWSCRISLRFKKQYNSSRGGDPWVPQLDPRQVPFLNLADKSQVEFALVRAQTAILNPSKDWRIYASPEYEKRLSGDDEDLEVKFSPNVVVMEIIAPDIPNLSFIDLPGVIQTTESHTENYLIKLVGGLVEEYVKEEDCLILLAITMKDDAVNQSAARLARELGEDRTIGALTKPDTVEAGEYDQWIDILRGRSHRLSHGYFVTKQPNQGALNNGVDNTTARRQEAEFFATLEPWATDLVDLRHRFGTVNLAQYLSSELGKLIKRRLPTIIETIEGQAKEVEEGLSRLPAPPSENQVVIVERLLSAFNHDLRRELEGSPGKNRFQMELRSEVDEFTSLLKQSRPQILVLDSAAKENEELTQWKQQSARKGQGDWFGVMASPGGPRREETPTPSRGAMAFQGSTGTEEGVRKQSRTPVKRPFADSARRNMPNKRVKKYTLPRVRHIIESTSTVGLPNQVDPEAVKCLAKETLGDWKGKVIEFVKNMTAMLFKQVLASFESIFKRYDKSPIFEKAYHALEAFLNAAIVRHRERIERLYRLESTQIFTQNTQDFEDLYEFNYAILSERRRRNLEDQVEAAKEASLGDLGEIHYPPKTTTATPSRRRGRQAQVGAAAAPTADDDDHYDNFKKEVQVLAQVQAYHDIARKRFVDYVYMSIRGELLVEIENGILPELKVQLGMDQPDAEETCRKILVEDPEKERRRRELLYKKSQLQKAKDELNGYLM